LIVSFQTRELLEQCSRLEVAEKAFGTPAARLLIGLLADIEALEVGCELIAFFQEDAEIAGNGSLWIPIGAHYRATFIAVGTKVIRLKDGNPDWSKVQRLKLVGISKCD
jgi:hypothetical protein